MTTYTIKESAITRPRCEVKRTRKPALRTNRGISTRGPTGSDLYYIALGWYLGYPKCCVRDFIRRIESGRESPKVKRALHGSGFIPCMSCQLSHSKAELENLINMRRHEDIPFSSEWDYAWTGDSTKGDGNSNLMEYIIEEFLGWGYRT